MRYLLLLLLPIFAACSHTPVVTPSTIEVAKRVIVPAELLQLCPELKSTYPIKLEDILLEDLEIIGAYGECRKRQNSLVKAVQEILK